LTMVMYASILMIRLFHKTDWQWSCMHQYWWYTCSTRQIVRKSRKFSNIYRANASANIHGVSNYVSIKTLIDVLNATVN
jgi:hypothetical protein